jgi:energy-coupling factor transporter ATP-binding protein EcfA2
VVEEVFDLLDELDDRRDAKVEDLSGGQAKMVAIGRALALRPDLLILDEPLEGLAPVVVEKLKGYIRDINDRGIAVLVAESNVTHVPEVVDRLAVIERGGDSRPRRPRRGRAGRGDRAADAGQRRGVTATGGVRSPAFYRRLPSLVVPFPTVVVPQCTYQPPDFGGWRSSC